MKKIWIIIAVVLILGISFFVGNTSFDSDALWKDAIYKNNTELGKGSNSFVFEVVAGEKTVTFTINSNAETVGEALVENGLISGEEGAYGMYVKVVNGITADYDADKSYWSFCKNGEYMQTGVDRTELKDGEKYEFVYVKE